MPCPGNAQTVAGKGLQGVYEASAASALPLFNVNSGVASVGPFVQAIVPVSDRWTFFGRAAYGKLRGDAAASPIRGPQPDLFAGDAELQVLSAPQFPW